MIPQESSLGVPPPMEGYFPVATDTYRAKTIIFDKFEYLPLKYKDVKLIYKDGLFRTIDM